MFIAGMRNLLVGMVVIKTINAKAEIILLTLKLNKTIRADTIRTFSAADTLKFGYNFSNNYSFMFFIV